MARPEPVSSVAAGAAGAPAAPTLELRGVTAGYRTTTVLREVDLTVPAGGIVALIGPNGAGKTTLLRTASGLLRPTAGQVALDGAEVTSLPPSRRARRGLCHIPEGRGIFPNLTVRENLLLQVPRRAAKAGLDDALTVFPALRDKLGRPAGTLSGGQQQMVALSRSLLAEPRVVLLDEVSIGLSPQVVDEIFTALARLAATGVSLLLVEQYVDRALDLAHHVYLLSRGSIAFSGVPGELDRVELMRRYVGVELDAAVPDKEE